MDVDVEYDSNTKVYSVFLKKGDHHLKTYLEPEDADICMDGKQCIGLGFQIQQLRNDIWNSFNFLIAKHVTVIQIALTHLSYFFCFSKGMLS